ncbi:MAG TPA: ABC transporter ATP-binding protein [Desulfobulbaceae bacterium]|nr:ABC transporter ATP-binding protein [Desulfobulbaceae bacterium]
MIILEEVNRIFSVGGQEVRALDGINLQVKPGEYISIMGPSGSGKSTLLNLLGLLDRPTSGRYLLSGSDVTGLDDKQSARIRNKTIGFVFQFFHLIPRLSAVQNIELPLLLAGIPPRKRREKSTAIINDFGLFERRHHKPEELSGGQRQRVAIARAVINSPSLLLADEPTGNLDSKSGLDIITLLEALNQQGLTLIVVTHDLEIGSRARRRIHFLDGRIVADS